MAASKPGPEPLPLSKAERYGAFGLLFFAILIFWLAPSLTALITHKSYDQQMRWRAARRAPSLDIVVVKVHKDINGDPAETFAKLIATTARGNPKAVGLDYIPQTLKTPWPGSWPEVAPYRDQVVIGCRVAAGKDDYPALPATEIATGFANQLGYLNLEADSDGAVRRYLYDQRPIPSEYGGAAPSFGARLAELAGTKPGQPKALIDYRDWSVLPTRATEVSDEEVLAHQSDVAWLRERFTNKFVLIGSGTVDDGDLHVTPLNQATFGVEIQASGLQTMLEGFPLREAPRGGQVLLFVVTAALSFLVTRLWSQHHYLLAGAGGAAIWFAVASALFVSKGLYFPAGPPLAGLAILAIGQQGLWALGIERSRKALRETFARYVSPDVMDELLKLPLNPASLPIEKKDITVMFTDINNFSTQCESLNDPVKVTRMLSVYFDEMSTIVFQHGGTIMRFIGDEFLIIFGAPRKMADPELAAVKTALAMHRRLDELKRSAVEPGFFEIKVGIHHGPMVLAAIGTRGRSDYNVIGDAANVASRIQGLCKELDRRLLVSDAVWHRIEAHPELVGEAKGETPVKGRSAAVKVFSVTTRATQEQIPNEPIVT